MRTPNPRTAEGQVELNRLIEEHDRQAAESGAEGQTFEISGGS